MGCEGETLKPPNYLRDLQKLGSVYLPKWCEGLSLQDAGATIGKVLNIEELWPGAAVPTVQRLEAREPAVGSGRRYSDIYGRKRFPFHTDLAQWAVPPRYLLLRCVKGAAGVRTGVLDAGHYISLFGRAGAKRALFRSRNPISSISSGSILPLLEDKGGREIFRWDPEFLLPANGFAAEVRDKIVKAELSFIQQAAYFSLLQPNDTLVIDNWRYLHCRTEVPGDAERVVERIYLTEFHG